MIFRSTLVAVAVFSAAAVQAQDVVSGPEKGKPAPALTVFDATGPHAGKDVDAAADRTGKPSVFVFIPADKWTRPMARYLKALDAAAKKADAAVVAVWLTDDAAKTKDNLPIAQQSLQFEATSLTCYPGDKAGPKGWNVNADAHLTTVVSDGRRVAATFGYQSVNETNVPEAMAALKKAGR